MKQFEISVIIPVFKGKKFIPYLLKVLHSNFHNLMSELHVQGEVIFVNDYPDEILEIGAYWKSILNIQVINLPINRGIHNARITGLSNARGDFVLFLDQDDQIAEDYIVSQKKKIKDEDAVLCNGYIVRYCISGKRIIYPDIISHKNAILLTNLINQGNPIVSPGQMVIKKESIPDLWKKVTMSRNGADDYLLWILMMSEGRKIIINESKLYTHIGQGDNSSQNLMEMQNSLIEMIKLLKHNNILPRQQLKILESRVNKAQQNNKLLGMITLYDQWMYIKIRNENIVEYLLKKGVKKIAIYGMNYIGNRLYDELKGSEIEILVGIDQNADKILYDIPVFKLNDIELRKYVPQIDMIVITAVFFYQDIKKEIENYYRIPLISMNDILRDMINAIKSSGEV